MSEALEPILRYLLERRGLDFSGCHHPMLERRIGQRLSATACAGTSEYFSYLQANEDELDRLIDVVTINVSGFFRDSLTFEILAERILPAIILEKIRARDHSLRVWSAGCSNGEEPYSVAILIHELLEKEGMAMDVRIFATDIDKGALEGAEKTVYPRTSIENVKHRLLTKYFVAEGASFRLSRKIKELVTFSYYDILDKRHGVPQESVFGSFDIVLCRNLLIYFNTEYQEAVLEKLYHSLAGNGYLVLGEAETPTIKYRRRFTRLIDFSPIYRKRWEER